MATGHIIGYQHTFVHAMADFLKAINSGTKVEPNLVEGVEEMKILDAALESARIRRAVDVVTKEIGDTA
jgi:predicted dehydrogenase